MSAAGEREISAGERARRAPPRCIALAAVTVGVALSLTGVAAASPDPFQAHGVDGAFVLLDVPSDTWVIVHRGVAETRFLPHSSFKIANTLIGLETGVITGEHFSLKWDGVVRARAEWNRDQDLASALKVSAVWFYQEVARRIGPRRMRAWVKKLGYGNRDAAGPIDAFWLRGPLRISAMEQVDFLRRLQAGELPVGRDHVQLLLRLLELDRGPGWVLRGKPGLGPDGKGATGWMVGTVDQDGAPRWIYALVLRAGSTETLVPLRRSLAEELLRRHGAIPAR